MIAAFGHYVLDAGGSDNDYDSILAVALCAATIGFLLGFAAELLPWHRIQIIPEKSAGSCKKRT